MRRLTILLLVVAALAVWALSGSRNPTLPNSPSRSDWPEDEPAAIPDVVPGDVSSDGSTTGCGGSIFRGPGRIKGTVKDADGRGIGGATVTEIHADGASTVTDADGHYELAVSRPDPTLRIEAAGFAPRITGKVGEDLELLRGATITGRVTDHAERPVEGAKVFELRDPERFVRTDAGGNFRFEGARTRHPTMLAAHHRDYLPGQSRLLNLRSGAELTGLGLVVRRPSRIRGTVRPWPGTAAVPTRVWIESSPEVSVETADGNFLLEPAGAGRAVVLASTPAGRVARCAVDVPEFGEREGVELRLGAIFSVRVLDARGDLVPGVTVEVRCEGGQCPGHGETGSILSEEMAQIASRTISRIGPDGTLRIGLPFAKAWVVWARWSGGGTAVAPFRIEPSEETRILRVPRLAAISGRVLLKGQPVRRFNVSIQRKDGHSTVAGKDGAFRFGSLPPGPATIRILSPQGWSDPMEIVLQPGEDRGDLEFEIRPGRFVVCRVTGKDGLPVLGAVVKIRSAQGIEKKGTWVSSAGLAHMIPAEPGRHTLRVYDIEGKLRAEREIEVKAGENANVTILLKEKW